MFAPIGEQVCDGSYIAFVMKKVNGPAQAVVPRFENLARQVGIAGSKKAGPSLRSG
jgi:hypothetical protein